MESQEAVDVGVAETPGVDQDQGSALVGPTVVYQAAGEEAPAVLEGSTLLVDLDAELRVGRVDRGEDPDAADQQGAEGPVVVVLEAEGPVVADLGAEVPDAADQGAGDPGVEDQGAEVPVVADLGAEGPVVVYQQVAGPVVVTQGAADPVVEDQVAEGPVVDQG